MPSIYKKKRKVHPQLSPSSEGTSTSSTKRTNVAITDVKVKGNVADEGNTA